MNRQTISFLFLFLLSAFGYSQDMLEVITSETCDCVAGKDVTSFDAEQLNLELGFCMIESLNRHKDADSALDVNIYDAESMRKLGEQIGMRMAVTCPAVIAKIAAISRNDSAAGNEVEGTLVGIEGKEFGFVIVQDVTGRAHKLLWLRYFDNSEKLMQHPAEAIGKRVRVRFDPIECYSPAERDYFERREITTLEFLNR